MVFVSTGFATQVQKYMQANFDANKNGALEKEEVAQASNALKQWTDYYNQTFAPYKHLPEFSNFLNTLQNYATVAREFEKYYDIMSKADSDGKGLSDKDIEITASKSDGKEWFTFMDVYALSQVQSSWWSQWGTR